MAKRKHEAPSISQWERLTKGCIPGEGTGKRRRTASTAEFKAATCSKAAKARARAHAAKAAHLREAGAHSSVARLSDSWTKRTASNIKGFWKESEARK